MSEDAIEDPQFAVKLLDELAGPLDQIDHIGPLSMLPDLIGQATTAPVIALLDPTTQIADDRLHLGMQIGDPLFPDLGGDDVHQLVLS